jgi:putative hydrolase of the HAD superfamily
MIRAVFFDVGGTLIHPWPSVGAVYAGVGERFGLRASAEAMEGAFRTAWKESKRGLLTTSDREWWRSLVQRAVAGLGLLAPAGYFEALYDAFAEPDAWRIYPDVLETLALTRARGVHCGVISNWDERLRPLLHRLGLGVQFDSLTISCEVGVEKPALAVFQAALAAAGVQPEESLHVGDSAEEDMAGATAAGMTALLVRQAGANDLGRVLALL